MYRRTRSGLPLCSRIAFRALVRPPSRRLANIIRRFTLCRGCHISTEIEHGTNKACALAFESLTRECARAGARCRDSDKAPQTTVNWSDLVPTRPKLSAIWIVTLWRPRKSSASSTVTPDVVGLACASIRLVMSMPREPYLTRRLFTTIVALLAG